MELDYSWVYCPDCNMTLVFESQGEPDSMRSEQIACPRCGMDLGEIRSDHGFDLIGMACGYLYPGQPCCGGGI